MGFRTIIADPIPERATTLITATLKDELGVVIPAAGLTTLTLTIYEKETLAIVNAVTDTNILNTGRGTVGANGLLTLTLDPLDNQIVSTAGPLEERHILLIEFTYGAGKAGRHEIEVTVRNLALVP